MPAQTGTTITMPQLGESVTEGTIGNWLKRVGDRIEKYEPLCEIETDKASAELPAPLAGVLTAILIEPGTTVPVGAELCRIEESDPDAATAESPPTEVEPSHNDHTDASHDREARRARGQSVDETHLLRARSSPVVRRMAEEHGIDISQVHGTGIEGRVTKKDILAFIAQGGPPPATQTIVGPSETRAPQAQIATPSNGAAPRSASQKPPLEPQPPSIELQDGDEIIPVTTMRRRIAARMVESIQTAPQATVVMEVDMTRVAALRDARKDAFLAREGVGLTYLPFVIKAVTIALRDHPRLNAVWDEERIIHRRALNIGVAVALDDGLVVPVIRNADRLSIGGLMLAIAELADRVRSNTYGADDLAGGTFTVNNPGTFGSVVSTPILAPPQVAILSTEAIIKRPVVIDDMIAIRAMMNLSLTIDHRALDGLTATRFLAQVKSWLENVPDDLSLY